MADLAAKSALNKSVTPLLIPYSDYKASIRTYIRDLMQKKSDTHELMLSYVSFNNADTNKIAKISGTVTNVAERKQAWMSSTFDQSHAATKAVDGDTTADGFSHVAHTATDQSSAWWKVDLQTTVRSARVTLYFRTDFKYRRNGVHLYTSETNSVHPKEGNLCHNVTGRPDGADIPDVLNVICPGTWRYLTVYTDTDNDGDGPVLDFAEVQVWICTVGMYGPDCTRSCSSRHCKVLSSTCDHITGTCRAGGCQDGWMGVDCTTECPSGAYGANCAKNCSSRPCKTSSTSCNRISGACPDDGCEDGWMGADCTKDGSKDGGAVACATVIGSCTTWPRVPDCSSVFTAALCRLRRGSWWLRAIGAWNRVLPNIPLWP
ncbi:uncharacterized protein [Haliotis asinina]|uniref:uncharacterized protein n=1 Tax=Haliotis asinina TaxID=109174 RepID=UPI0035322350